MDFPSFIAASRLVLTEGSIIEHLRRESSVRLDPFVANSSIIYDRHGREIMASLFRRYLATGRESGLPMVIETPTWRANPDRIKAAGLAERRVNEDCFRFIADLRSEQGDYAPRVAIAGLMGPAGDAYQPGAALPEDDAAVFHRWQAHALARAGCDFLLAATLPAASEAIGLARAMAITGLPYVLSFVARPDGTILDGTPLADIIAIIDASLSPRPFGYMVNCVHPTVFAQAMAAAVHKDPAVARRVIGLQANTSRKSPEELEGSACLEREDPAQFGREMLEVHNRFGTRLLGGCCGTSPDHIAAIARAYIDKE